MFVRTVFEVPRTLLYRHNNDIMFIIFFSFESFCSSMVGLLHGHWPQLAMTVPVASYFEKYFEKEVRNDFKKKLSRIDNRWKTFSLDSSSI